ncbi:MAG TPA: UDP-N-acetylmuramoyl-L-alanyl-D-glutamate--2,6-diaminopimelate ligase [Acidimicrobiia bacterium]|nr:UDP-N-acetylmuramoyl-L-alanyl-D-glutamate--2,6-diaminopimelate ligase [Acidimicrobiia bacterium]
MRLHDMLAGLDVRELLGGDVEVTSITNDSRRVQRAGCFACIPGARVDGHDFAAAAVAGGASALLVERVLDPAVVGTVAQARVRSVRAALGPAASTLHGHPSRALRCLGVTGTNGKTTTTFLLESIAREAHLSVGVIGTVGARVDGAPFASAQVTPTTPEASDLQALLAAMRDVGVGVVAMEVSSHGLERREVDGTTFAAVCFTNLSHEHLDFHGTMDAYFDAKARLFDGSFAPAAAVNLDDEAGRRLAARVASTSATLITFGTRPDARFAADEIAYDGRGTSFTLVDRDADERAPVRTSLVGPFNVSNALAAAATGVASGFSLDAVAAGLDRPVALPGRMQAVEQGQGFTVLVDYAHTPDALTHVLGAARAIAGEARVLAVFGAGGDRDRAKRPLMGEAVARAADVAVLTSDNPRSEAPEEIAGAVLRGLRVGPAAVMVELDRRAAIRLALDAARPGDVVVIAGKGHETGQTVGDRTLPFDDRVVAGEELGALGWS